MREEHPIAPVFDGRSEILILGSFPSVRSREIGFFYGHPANRFWSVTAAVRGREIPVTTDEKRAFLLSEKIALWDVIASCDIVGSSDAHIRNAVPNDLSLIFERAPIRAVFTNGAKADALFRRFFPHPPVPARRLPSTSPANAAWSFERLCAAWSVIGQAGA